MPEGQGETEEILHFLAEHISTDCYLNLMDQYRPCGRIATFSELQETIDSEHYRWALLTAKELGLKRLDQRDLGTLLQHLFRK
jgi:putative pyruvate formate lyase activating enzyme